MSGFMLGTGNFHYGEINEVVMMIIKEVTIVLQSNSLTVCDGESAQVCLFVSVYLASTSHFPT